MDNGNVLVTGGFSGRAGRRGHDLDRGSGSRLQVPIGPDEKRHDLATGKVWLSSVFFGRAGCGGRIWIGVRCGSRVSPLTAAG